MSNAEADETGRDMFIHRALSIFLIAAAGVAWAHEGVENPAVMARMDAMSEIGAAHKVLRQMALGEAGFDATAAEAARERLIGAARQTPRLFEAREDDPKSEAKPAIWENFGDFTEKSDALVLAATAAELSSLDALKGAVGEIGQACVACHDLYRE
ncbi:MAG: cytochrome c [Paracoccaceae bacterium]|nr:cytochrome c [Paracoccaceae bacterium]